MGPPLSISFDFLLLEQVHYNSFTKWRDPFVFFHYLLHKDGG